MKNKLRWTEGSGPKALKRDPYESERGPNHKNSGHPTTTPRKKP